MCAEPRACGSPCEQGRGQSRAVPRYVSTDGVDLTLRGVVRREPRVPLPPSHCSEHPHAGLAWALSALSLPSPGGWGSPAGSCPSRRTPVPSKSPPPLPVP